MGWAGKIRVNGTTYKWLGADNTGIAANVTNIQVTPTRTIFVLHAGPMNVTVTFLSPVEVRDYFSNGMTCLSANWTTRSPTTGSSNRCPSPMCRWKLSPLTETAIPCKSTLTSARVRLGAFSTTV